MLRIADVPERGGEIGRPDEHAVDAVDRGDRLELLEGGARLDLDQEANLAVRLLEIIGHPAVAAGARGRRNAANAGRRIADRRDRAARLVGVLHIGHEDRLRADVEHALDQHGVVPGRPHDRRRGAARRCLQLRHQTGDLVRRVLAVEQDPVEARIGDDLGGDVAAQAAPQADLQLAGGDRLLEAVAGELHGGLTRTARRCRRAGRNRRAACRPSAPAPRA